jgi:hypothetical protein
MTLPLAQRFRLSWEIIWPFTLIDLAMVVVIHGVLDAQGALLDVIWGVASFFIVAPWVVRRALKRNRIVAVTNQVAKPELNYQQSFKAMWLLSWRTIPLTFAALFLISLLIKVAGITLPRVSTDDPLVNSFGLSIADTISSLVLYPLIIPSMLRKRYRGFHLEVR